MRNRLFKKAAWTALSASITAASGIVARRIAIAIWQRALHEEPPTAR
jgi:hypothetical protein